MFLVGTSLDFIQWRHHILKTPVFDHPLLSSYVTIVLENFDTGQAFFYRLKVQAIQGRLFLPFKGPGGSLGPLYDLKNHYSWPNETLHSNSTTRTRKEISKYMTYDVTMTSLVKQWENSDLCETRQIGYHPKGNNWNFPKM